MGLHYELGRLLVLGTDPADQEEGRALLLALGVKPDPSPRQPRDRPGRTPATR